MTEPRYLLIAVGGLQRLCLDARAYPKEEAEAEADRRRVLGWTIEVVTEKAWEIELANRVVAHERERVASAQRDLDRALERLAAAERMP